MARYSSLLAVTLPLVLLNPVFADEAREISLNDATTPTEWLEFAAVDFCYRGIVVDPETGEATEIYAPCSEDVIEGNLDLA
jgi:hypothetical protein